MNPICMAKHPSRNNTWCDHRPGHDGPHKDSSGVEWGSPAGSYTRTDEPNGTPDCEAELGHDVCTRELDHDGPHIAATVVLNNSIGVVWGYDSDRRAETAEKALDAAKAEAAMCQTSLNGQIRRAELAEDALVEMTAHRDQCRDTAIKWQVEAFRVRGGQSRPIEVTDEMSAAARAKMVDLWGWAYEDAVMKPVIAAALTLEPQRPEGAEGVECALLDADEAGVLASDQERIERLADFLAERGVRVASVGLTPTNPEEQALTGVGNPTKTGGDLVK